MDLLLVAKPRSSSRRRRRRRLSLSLSLCLLEAPWAREGSIMGFAGPIAGFVLAHGDTFPRFRALPGRGATRTRFWILSHNFENLPKWV